MSDQNTYTIFGMCAIVITLYALKESHTHYLPDFFGLVLAMLAPRPSYAIGAVLVLAIIRHTPLASGLAESIPSWLLVVALPGARHMSISSAESSALEAAYKARISEGNSNDEMVETERPVAESTAKIITLAESEILARLILAEKIGLTDAIRIGAGAKSGARYQATSKIVKEAIERLRNHYPPGSTLKRFE